VTEREDTGSIWERAPAGLRPRKRPTQARARNLVDKILDTTADLLDEVGLDALSTNLIAERAGIRVSSIYRYFPNKHAIMVALWDRVVARWLEVLARYRASAGEGASISDLVDGLVETAAHLDRSEPGLIPLMRAMRASPELHEVEVRSNRLVAERIAEALAVLGVRLPKRRLGVVARMLTESTSTVLELSLAVDDEREERFLLAELKRMLRNYLADYLDGGDERVSAVRPAARPASRARRKPVVRERPERE